MRDIRWLRLCLLDEVLQLSSVTSNRRHPVFIGDGTMYPGTAEHLLLPSAAPCCWLVGSNGGSLTTMRALA